MFLGLSVTILDCVHRSSGMGKGQLFESDGADPSTRPIGKCGAVFKNRSTAVYVSRAETTVLGCSRNIEIRNCSWADRLRLCVILLAGV